MSLPYTDNVTPLQSVTAAGTTISAAFDVSKRQKLSLQLLGTAISSGNGLFTVKVSNDGVHFVTYNRLTDNLTNTNAQNDTRVQTVTINSNQSKIYFFPSGDYFRYIKVAVFVTTDGKYTATLQSAG